MRAKQWIIFVLSLFLLLNAVPSVAGAADKVSFRMTVTEKGNQVVVTVHAEQVSDLYAYDVILETDAEQLKLKATKSEMTGFAVGPIIEGDQIRFANTKTGKSPGTNGNAKLVTFTFERLKHDPTDIQLNKVQLVNSKLAMVEYIPSLISAIKKFVPWGDIVGHWAELSIRQAMEQGVVNGYDDFTFRPNREVTRAEFAAMLVRVLDLPMPAEPKLTFTDKDRIPAWARPYVAAVANAKLIVGYDDGTFRADKQINREEMAAIMVRAFGIEMIANKETSFVDSDQLSEWARPYIAAAVDAGIMNGRGGNRFAPKQLATRAEAVVVLLKR